METEERHLTNIATNERFIITDSDDETTVTIAVTMPRKMDIPRTVFDAMVASPHEGEMNYSVEVTWSWRWGDYYVVVTRKNTDPEATVPEMTESIPVQIWEKILGRKQ